MEYDHENHEECAVSKNIRYRTKWIFSLVFIPMTIFLIRPFMAKQIFYRATSYQSCGLRSDSIRQYKKALLIDGDNADVWCSLADLHKEMGNIDEALKAYERAVVAELMSRRANYSLGMTLALYKQQYAEGMRYWERVREIGPEDADENGRYMVSYYKLSLSSLAIGYQKLNKIDKAIAILEELLEYYPKDEELAEKLKQISALRNRRS